MGEVVSRERAYEWSINRIAEAIGRDRRTVAKVIREAAVSPCGTRHGNPVYRLADVVEAMTARQSENTGAADVGDFQPQDRKAWFQSENERVKLERELRNLVPVEEAQREMSILAKAMASGLDSLADMLERDAGLPPEAIEQVERITDALREQMYRAIVADEDEGAARA
ncbi:DUF1441 family protein [Billgrantia montanilacus]|uniref:DUF1441 family protein n=1 Tax=Billgrantia montanilacus TaxID=2282305 RepID=A0A368TRY8_9GAMM|nr:DUF1441 family protein [Halomonas montanilacus]RCV87485.1 DUF1441 family protein [Halomonas montanilacus]